MGFAFGVQASAVKAYVVGVWLGDHGVEEFGPKVLGFSVGVQRLQHSQYSGPCTSCEAGCRNGSLVRKQLASGGLI